MAENATWSPVGGWGLLNGRLARVVDLLRQGQRYSVQSVTGDTTLAVLATGQVVLVDTTAGSVVVTLPPANEAVGRLPLVVKQAGVNTVTVSGGDALIDGGATVTLTSLSPTARFVSDGTSWVTV